MLKFRVRSNSTLDSDAPVVEEKLLSDDRQTLKTPSSTGRKSLSVSGCQTSGVLSPSFIHLVGQTIITPDIKDANMFDGEKTQLLSPLNKSVNDTKTPRSKLASVMTANKVQKTPDVSLITESNNVEKVGDTCLTPNTNSPQLSKLSTNITSSPKVMSRFSPKLTVHYNSTPKSLNFYTPKVKLNNKILTNHSSTPKIDLGLKTSDTHEEITNSLANNNNHCSTPNFQTNTGLQKLTPTPKIKILKTPSRMLEEQNIYSTPCNDDTEREPTYQSLSNTRESCSKSYLEEVNSITDNSAYTTFTDNKCLTKHENDDTKLKSGFECLAYLSPNRFLSPVDRSSFMRSQVKYFDDDRNWQEMTKIIFCLLSLVMNLECILNVPIYLMRWKGEGVIIYILILLFLGLPLFIMEVLVGSSENLCSSQVWASMVPLMCGLGTAFSTASLFLAAKTCAVVSYCLVYLITSVYSPVPWTECHSWWNPDFRCFSTKDIQHLELNQSLLCTLYDLAGEDCHSHSVPSHVHYWQHYVLKSDGRGLRVLGNLGSPNLILLSFAAIVWILMGIITMLSKLNLTRLVTSISCVSLLIVLSTAIWNIVRNGSFLVVKEFLIMENLSTLMDMDCYLQAFWLVVTGLNLFNGSVVSCSSLFRKVEHVKLISVTCVLLHVLFLVLLTLTVLPLVPEHLNPTEMMFEKEIGYFPFAMMSVNLEPSTETSVLTFLVYLLPVLAGFNLIIGLLCTVKFGKQYRVTRSRRFCLSVIVSLAGFFCSLPLVYECGPNIVSLYHMYGYKIPIHIMGPILTIALFWMYGCRRLATRIEGNLSNLMLVAAWAITPITLILLGGVFFIGGVKLSEPVPLPEWAHNLGIFLVACSVLQVVAGFLAALLAWMSEGKSMVREQTHIMMFKGDTKTITELCEMRVGPGNTNTYKSFDDILHAANIN